MMLLLKNILATKVKQVSKSYTVYTEKFCRNLQS